MSKRNIATVSVRAGIDTDHQHGAVVPPIYLSSNYTFADFDQPRQYDYTRSGNPTRDALAEALAELEQGAKGVITSTGMAAVHLATMLLEADDLLVVPHDCYGGSYRLFTNLEKKGHFKLLVVDQNDPTAFAAALAQKPKMVWVETPSNPLLRVVDVAAICEQAHAQGALVTVDNTFLSPVLQQPLTLGADIVVHSTTKYINGHSDVVGGAVVAKEQAMGDDLAWWANCIGITGSPFDSFLTMRGLRTLKPRVKQHQDNAAEIIKFLQQQTKVAAIYHPSLPDHPGHEIAKRQQHGFGAMLSFELKGGVDEVKAFLSGLSLFSLAESLGGVESLVAHPATMTHAAMDEAARIEAGIGNNLLRLSVGIEDVADLIADLQAGFDAV
ncbi:MULTISPECIES: cystathionine gamma-synthase [Corallincola]|uniref:Cystathionine gamma-synthase n=3 Tax=Corallincola TaxID=1775176 RepID=A0A368N6C4_9GAMM|nr:MULTISPECIES: cystathionine gamma-synthase [Corallincola]RCU45104.1 cystathionine gamma-synthase [Corallincola holothuriorum]TAA46850.1 cystathionine gamma-synthase [Corallincola spongiicola]TCI04496.1 cystathionine gamma-synthase [Corallincola luteus]